MHFFQIAFRASILEQENAILKSQVFSLRDEITALRQMLFPSATASLQLTTPAFQLTPRRKGDTTE